MQDKQNKKHRPLRPLSKKTTNSMMLVHSVRGKPDVQKDSILCSMPKQYTLQEKMQLIKHGMLTGQFHDHTDSSIAILFGVTPRTIGNAKLELKKELGC